jgi:hypothetical protein
VYVDTLAVRLRPRTAHEATDLGVRLCQISARSVYACYAAAALPVLTASMLSFALAIWLPVLLIWWAKPWLDRTILFVLSRAAFGQETTVGDLWRARRQVWWNQFFLTWTLQRLSLWRSLTQPIYQLEGLSFRKAGARVRQIRRPIVWSAIMTTQLFAIVEWTLTVAVLSFAYWFALSGRSPSWADLISGDLAGRLMVAIAVAYACAVLFLEPFYVAAGFAAYLTRRTDLEAWDIEQEFRRAFGS